MHFNSPSCEIIIRPVKKPPLGLTLRCFVQVLESSQNLLTDKRESALGNTDMNSPWRHYQGDLCVSVPREDDSFSGKRSIYAQAAELLLCNMVVTVAGMGGAEGLQRDMTAQLGAYC